MAKNAIFIAATGKHVGKTTTSLGIFSGLQQRCQSVGFIKPIGQQYIKINETLMIDKDVYLLKNYFNLKTNIFDMSPVLLPSGFTRNFLDKKISKKKLKEKILLAFEKISSSNAYVLVEGTGHLGVGSIVNLNNAQVAKILNLDVVIVAPGGIGSTFDELSLNVMMCKKHKVRIRGIILNRVFDDKRDMIIEYVSKALKRWKIPLIGCIPFNKFLSAPSMKDFENLFKTKLISGKKHQYRHFLHMHFVAALSVDQYMKMKISNQMIVTHSKREDIILATIEKHKIGKNNKNDPKGGMILTSPIPPNKNIIEKAKEIDLPIIYIPMTAYEVIDMISHHIGKIRNEDTQKIEKAISLVKENINFDSLVRSS